MSRHRNVRRLYSDDYNDYNDLVPSSVEDDYGLSPNTMHQFIHDPSNPSRRMDFFMPQLNGSLNISASEFPENDDIENGKVDKSDEAVELQFDDLMVEGGGQPYEGGQESTALSFQPFESCSEWDTVANEVDFSSLANLTDNVTVKPQSSGPSSFTPLAPRSAFSVSFTRPCKMHKQINFDPDSQQKLNVSSSSSHVKHVSALASFFSYKLNRVIVPQHTQHFIDLMITLRRCRPSLFLHYPPPSKCPQSFRFDTPAPVLFDSTIEVSAVTKRSDGLPRPRTRATHPKHGKDRVVDGASESVTTVLSHLDLVDPVLDEKTHTNIASKAPSEARIPSVPNKPIDRTPLLNAYEEKVKSGKEKDTINLLVVGHVDAGKSTLMGNVLYQLGQVSEKQIAKYQWEAQKIGKASFAYAWVLDQTTEERNRGITMDIAQTAFETPTKRIVLLDAPGHRDFVPQVIGGAAQADVALLVVNATSGEFETGMLLAGGQTQEHARLVRLLGVSRLIVAVNKMDTVGWSEARFEEIRAALLAMLKTINQADVVFCPVSGLLGVNLLHSTDCPPEADIEKLAPWYNGPCLLDIIDNLDKIERPVAGPFRFVVSDIFKPIGSSVPIVAGRVVSGAVSAGVNLPTSRVICLPSGQTGSVRSIRSLAGTSSDGGMGLLDHTLQYAFAGDQVGLMLSGIAAGLSLSPGDVICDPDPPLVPVTSLLRAKVLVFAISQPITRGYPVIFYYHCSSVPATVSKLISATVKGKGHTKKEVSKPRCLLGNCTAEIELTLEQPVCLEIYEVCKPLGRFVLRVGGESIAGGTVTALVRQKSGPPPPQPPLDLNALTK